MGPQSSPSASKVRPETGKCPRVHAGGLPAQAGRSEGPAGRPGAGQGRPQPSNHLYIFILG